MAFETAPKPAWFGLSFVVSTVPSARIWLLVTVWLVGLVRFTVVLRLLKMTAFGALNASARSWSWRPPPRRIVRASDKSSVRLAHAWSRLRPDSSPRLPTTGPEIVVAGDRTKFVLPKLLANWAYWLLEQPAPSAPTLFTRMRAP